MTRDTFLQSRKIQTKGVLGKRTRERGYQETQGKLGPASWFRGDEPHDKKKMKELRGRGK